MDPTTVGILGLILFLVLLAVGVQIGVALFAAGILGMAAIVGFQSTLTQMGLVTYSEGSSYMYSLLPLFIIMGSFAMYGGVAEAAYAGLYRWVCKVPGALALATTLACAAFGAASGSSVAAAAIFARVSLPEMIKYKYDRRLAAGCIAASGTFATMIPPSVLLILYGIFTETSIARLFMAGIMPGLITAFVYGASIFIRVRRNPSLAPIVPGEVFTRKEKLAGLGGLVPAASLGVIVVGGIYGGWITPTETGAAGAIAALILAFILKRGFRGMNMLGILRDAATTQAMLMVIMIGSFMFGRFLAVSRVPTDFALFVESLPVAPVLILTIFLVMYFLLGMIMTAVGMVAITMPIVAPVISGLGYDLVWFGIIIIKMCEIAVVTPPVGMNVYVVQGAGSNYVTIEDTFAGIWPFVLCDLIVLGLLIAFPQIVLFLPNLVA